MSDSLDSISGKTFRVQCRTKVFDFQELADAPVCKHRVCYYAKPACRRGRLQASGLLLCKTSLQTGASASIEFVITQNQLADAPVCKHRVWYYAKPACRRGRLQARILTEIEQAHPRRFDISSQRSIYFPSKIGSAA